jgi:maleate isomerase
MPDTVGTRAKWAVIVPSTNTVVDHDFWMMKPRGITFHMGRMFISQPNIRSNADFEALVDQIRDSLERAIKDIMTCEPDYLVMGISVESFWGGLERAREYIKSLEDMTGLKVATGADACRRAAEVLNLKKIALVTPYQPVGDDQVVNYFKEIGIETVRVKGLKAPSATGIAAIDEQTLIRTLRDELDGDDIDGIFQAGTNMSMVRLADEAERWLGKPVVAINAATLWHSLRSNGFTDQLDGFGSLLAQH